MPQHAIGHIELEPPFDTDRHGNQTIPVPVDFGQNIRNQYYIQQPPRDDHGPVTDIVHHLVQASIRNHDPQYPVPPHMQPGKIIHPITRIAALGPAELALDPFSKKKPPEISVKQAVQLLQHKGIIRRMLPTAHFLRLHLTGLITPEEHCTIPIPTITEYMRERFAKLPESKRDRIRRNVQHIMQEYPRDIGTQWQWNNVTRRKPIPIIKKVEHEPTPNVMPLAQKTASTLHFGSYIFQAAPPHYDQWT